MLAHRWSHFWHPIYDTKQACRKGGGGWEGFSPPVFGRSVNPISTRGGTLSPPSTISPPWFSDLATALNIEVCISALVCYYKLGKGWIFIQNLHLTCFKETLDLFFSLDCLVITYYVLWSNFLVNYPTCNAAVAAQHWPPKLLLWGCW